MSCDSWMKRQNRFPDLIEFAQETLNFRRKFLNMILPNNKELHNTLIWNKLKIFFQNNGRITCLENTTDFEGYMIYYYILVVLLEPYSRIKLFASNICSLSDIIPEINELILSGPVIDDAWKKEKHKEFEKIRNPEYKHPFVAPDMKITSLPATPPLDFSHMESYPISLENFCLSEDECDIVIGL